MPATVATRSAARARADEATTPDPPARGRDPRELRSIRCRSGVTERRPARGHHSLAVDTNSARHLV